MLCLFGGALGVKFISSVLCATIPVGYEHMDGPYEKVHLQICAFLFFIAKLTLDE